MRDLYQKMSLAEELVRQWEFQIGDAESAFGEIAGMPVVLTILGKDPLSLMMSYQIAAPHAGQVPLPEEIAKLVESKKASVSLEDGFAWLSFYNLEGKSVEGVRGLFESFAETLKEQGLALNSTCSLCGQPEEAGLVFLGGRCTRICEPCLSRKLEEREQAEAAKNRPSKLHSYALPWIIALAAVGWAVFWASIDFLLEVFNTDTVEINAFSMLVVVIVGFLLGAPLGHVLKKSGTIRLSPMAVTVIAIGLAAVVGEALYISFALFRFLGKFDLAWGFQVLIPFFQSYDTGWIVCKLMVAVAIGVGCFLVANERESVGLSI